VECDIDCEGHGEAVAKVGGSNPAALHVFFTLQLDLVFAAEAVFGSG
jgi:hypothetical protein